MSKKKAAATMSLRDFHGGSIPSDLPLPSAPGVVVRPGSDRSMHTNWGNNLMRSDLRPRPKSSGAAYSFDEKASFLSHPAPIGRNFDEDERKPLDGVSAPRTISGESVHGSAPVHQESKMDYASSVRIPDKLVSSSVTQSPTLGTIPSPARFHGGASVTVDAQNSSSNNGQVAQYSKAPSSNYSHNPPNAWGLRKEVMDTGEGCEAGHLSVSTGANAVSKFSQASAIEKVSSGMWQSKNPSYLLPQLTNSKDNTVIHGVDAGSEWSDYNASCKSQAEPVWVAEDGNQGRGRELLGSGSGQSQMYAEEARTGSSSIRSQYPSIVPPEISEHHKSKLLPTSESLDVGSAENSKRQGYQQAVNTGKMEIAQELYNNSYLQKPGIGGSSTDSRPVEKAVERPKLNLKPRTQLLDQTDGSLERKRCGSLFSIVWHNFVSNLHHDILKLFLTLWSYFYL
uniref:Uncharacterized protein n=1 Tax=Rhizophora mucronata TaxID=61149 RepID=A0A2P2J5D0_RHIMU